MSTTITHSAGGRVFWRFVGLSLTYYQKNVVSLLMTLVIPLGLLLFATFSFYALSGPSFISIGISDQIPSDMVAKIEEAKIDGMQIVPIAGDARKNVQDGKVKIAISLAPDTGQAVIYSLDQHRASADIISTVVAHALAGKHRDIAALPVQSVENGGSGYAFVPGLMIMSIINLALFTTGAKLLKDRANGTMRLYRLFPVPLYVFFSAELSTKFVLAMMQACVFVLLGDFLLEINLSFTRLLQTLGLAALCSVSLLIMGLAIGSNLRAASSGIHVFTLMNLTMVFLGDLMFPNSSTGATRFISALLPSTHCTNLLRAVMLDLPPSFDPALSVAYLAIFTSACMYLAFRGFKFTAEE